MQRRHRGSRQYSGMVYHWHALPDPAHPGRGVAGCTGAHALLFGMLSVYLGTVWFDTRARRLDDPSLESTATFCVLTSILALVCVLLWWGTRPRPDRPVQPGWYVWVQCVTALIAGGVMVAFFLT